MKARNWGLAFTALLSLGSTIAGMAAQDSAPLALPEEKHLRNVRQLTFSGENAEAYFSPDDNLIIFQAHEGEGKCDQIYTMDLEGKNRQLISTGGGKTTCGAVFPGGKRMIYASTHGAGPACPPPPDFARGYVWKMHAEFDIYRVDAGGKNLKRLTSAPGYDAEGTLSPDGQRIIFTSVRNGDFDLYVMDANGKNVKRLTFGLGYDGGAFFSSDGKRIVWRASRPRSPQEVADYTDLLKTNAYRPGNLEIYVMDADGSNQRQLTSNGAANFAPFFHPDGKRIIFASNVHNPRGRDFDLYLINVDGTGLERVTHSPLFDSFPMFSSDGKKLVWASNRREAHRGNTNVFLADWVE
jgi:Tol biopolymer transport system component